MEKVIAMSGTRPDCRNNRKLGRAGAGTSLTALAAALLALLQGCLSSGGNGDSYGGMRTENYYNIVDGATCSVSAQPTQLAVHSRIRVSGGKATLEGGCSTSGAESAAREISLSEFTPLDGGGRVYQYQGRVYELSDDAEGKDLKQTLAFCITIRTGAPEASWDVYEARVLTGLSGEVSIALDYVTHTLASPAPVRSREASYLVQPVTFTHSVEERRFKGEGLEIISDMGASVGLEHVKSSSFSLAVRGTAESREGHCHYFDLLQ
ncbi:MAG: hypothetical protein NDJ89_09285 [Oligoflexia bacterium]|nr:hypothetical protein [Oligoflexia bacterium]